MACAPKLLFSFFFLRIIKIPQKLSAWTSLKKSYGENIENCWIFGFREKQAHWRKSLNENLQSKLLSEEHIF